MHSHTSRVYRLIARYYRGLGGAREPFRWCAEGQARDCHKTLWVNNRNGIPGSNAPRERHLHVGVSALKRVGLSEHHVAWIDHKKERIVRRSNGEGGLINRSGRKPRGQIITVENHLEH